VARIQDLETPEIALQRAAVQVNHSQKNGVGANLLNFRIRSEAVIALRKIDTKKRGRHAGRFTASAPVGTADVVDSLADMLLVSVKSRKSEKVARTPEFPR
jgi:hypothetical protein